MDLRIKGLSHLDPLTVPLPNGTEVVTRVDRLLGERRIPEGAVGRVVAQHGGEFDVQIVGIGVARYSRDELVPRKVGQVRFARRREAVWSALRPCSVLETTVGSHAWGLADEASDTDVRGLFALPFSWTVGLAEPPLDLVSADGGCALDAECKSLACARDDGGCGHCVGGEFGRGFVLVVPVRAGPKAAEDRAGEVAIQLGHGPLGTGPSGIQHTGEVVERHGR